MRRRFVAVVAGFGAIAVAACLTAPLVGPTPISLGRVLDRSVAFSANVDAQIFFVARLPRTLAGALVGSALAASGVVFQALLRNPLATPYTLGISAGAALGAMLVITLELPFRVLGLPPVPAASFAGSLGAAAIVYALASARQRGLSTGVLLLAGVTLNAFFSALILFMQYLADFTEAARTLRWLVGSLEIADYRPLAAALPFVAAAFVIFAGLPRALNVLAAGAEHAAARGVDVTRTERLAFLGATLATGAAVSVSGPIGFVGILVPHLVRLMIGADHRLVLPASSLLGAAFLVVCDAIARTVVAPVELPVGVITAMLGGPFFLWLLLRAR